MAWPELLVLRHGETTWNHEKRMQGDLNSPLTAQGIAQAQNQHRVLEKMDLTGWDIWSSPMGRAFQTAGIAVAPFVTTIHTDTRLREIGVGDWTGRLRSELQYDGPQLDGPDGPVGLYAHAPGGEGFDALEQRCRDFLSLAQLVERFVYTEDVGSSSLRPPWLKHAFGEVGWSPFAMSQSFAFGDCVACQIMSDRPSSAKLSIGK